MIKNDLSPITKRVLTLIEEKEMQDKQLVLALGLANGAVTDWKKGRSKPSTDAIIKIADYFDVTTDYLLGRIEDRELFAENDPYLRIAKNEDEEELLSEFKALSKSSQRIVWGIIEQEKRRTSEANSEAV